MKIGPGLPLPISPRAAASADAPSQTFSAFLEEQAGTREGHTFGFAELGMFGVNRASADPQASQHRGHTSGVSQPLDPAPAEPRLHSNESDTLHERRGERSFGSFEDTKPVHIQRAMEGKPQIEAVANTTEDQGQVGVQAEELSDQTRPGRAERRGRFRQHLAALKSDVSLILSEKAGEVELIVRSPQLDPETRAALRRLARSILARNGLSLARFQLNGSALPEASTINMIGDPHGTRSH